MTLQKQLVHRCPRATQTCGKALTGSIPAASGGGGGGARPVNRRLRGQHSGRTWMQPQRNQSVIPAEVGLDKKRRSYPSALGGKGGRDAETTEW